MKAEHEGNGMKAVVYLSPGEVEVQERDRPPVNPGDVLLRVLSNTICGTDLRIARGIKRKGVIAPRILGHEVSAEVLELGAGASGIEIGDRVCVTPTFSCGACTECQRGRFHQCQNARVLGHQVDGGLAEYLTVPADAVRKGALIPYSAEADPVAMSLVEPLSCVLHGQQILDVSVDDAVVIIGGGAIGLLHTRIAKVRGAKTVIVSEPVEYRREIARRFGADVTVDPTNEDLEAVVAAHTSGQGADVIIVCIGIPVLVNQALALARNKGRVSLFAGFPSDQPAQVDANLVHYKELAVVGSSNSTSTDMRRAAGLIESGVVLAGQLITHRFALDEFHEAVDLIASPHALKIAIIPGSQPTT
ncbi:MAG: alcohol dehydrogenase [Microbacteriaceae bacterium]|nr:MAG: alcohol dehydrogenase [Microbacteriaceae bacterium]